MVNIYFINQTLYKEIFQVKFAPLYIYISENQLRKEVIKVLNDNVAE